LGVVLFFILLFYYCTFTVLPYAAFIMCVTYYFVRSTVFGLIWSSYLMSVMCISESVIPFNVNLRMAN